MHSTDPLGVDSVQLGGDEPSLFSSHRTLSDVELDEWEGAHARIRLQRDLCSSILTANRAGILTLSDGEMSVVRTMKGSGKPLKDTHIAVLQAFIERAGK